MVKDKQHVLIIGKVWMEPGSSAAGSRSLQLAETFLSLGWKISFATTAGESLYKADLTSLGITEFRIELNDASFDVFVKELDPDIVIFDRFTTEEQFGWRVARQCPNAQRILDTIDLHCLRTARQTALKENRDFTKADLFNETAKREVAAIYRCDLSLMISTVEMDLLINYFKVDSSLLHYVPFMPAPITEQEVKLLPGFAARRNFVTIGNFLHEPNWDSVLFLKRSVWPLVRKQLPGAELHVYGAYPTQKVFELNAPKEGFMVKGRAEDAGEVMKKARVCLAPLRFGAGIKGKLLDAMLYGTPSVTTPVGAESMHGELPWNGFIANDAEALAQAAVTLYNDQSQWEQASKNGVNIINNFFAASLHSKKLVEVILTTQDNLNQHRLDNFTGAMLMHHTASASKYMALWIEAKNK
ncbi:MAG: glycosyltransferase [Bacteroidota bacterium]